MAILRGYWQGWKYHEIAEAYGYTIGEMQFVTKQLIEQVFEEVANEKTDLSYMSQVV